jgi:N-dimethylarginine dimethylaminohydrolase
MEGYRSYGVSLLFVISLEPQLTRQTFLHLVVCLGVLAPVRALICGGGLKLIVQ